MFLLDLDLEGGKLSPKQASDRPALSASYEAMSSEFSTGDTVHITGLVNMAELNGTSATVHSWDEQLKRFKVRVDGKKKLLALHPQNLTAAVAGGEMSEIVSVKLPGKRARVAEVQERKPDGTVRIEFESAPGQSEWVDADATTALPAAEDDVVPTEFLYSSVLAREVGAPGKRRAFLPAEVKPWFAHA